MAFGRNMSVWFGNRTRAKVLKYEGYPLWLPVLQLPLAAILALAGFGLTPGAQGHYLIATLGVAWLARLAWCFFRITQTVFIKRRLRHSP